MQSLDYTFICCFSVCVCIFCACAFSVCATTFVFSFSVCLCTLLCAHAYFFAVYFSVCACIFFALFLCAFTLFCVRMHFSLLFLCAGVHFSVCAFHFIKLVGTFLCAHAVFFVFFECVCMPFSLLF